MSTINTSESILSGLSGSSSSSSTSSTSNSESSLGGTEFLQLLVTQLNNQNPLDPQSNTEFVAQLAQFSSVESLQSLNASMDTILSSFQSSRALQASALVGRSVLVETDQALVSVDESGGGLYGSLVLPSTSSSVSVAVYDDSGSKVRTISLGQQSAGTVEFSWDGTDDEGNALESGTYTFKASATLDGTETALTTYLPAIVSSVTLGQDTEEMTLNLAGLGSIALSKVKMIGQ
ncbi:flagellar biosynthesis protein FlgD [Pseudomonas daroniae]|uniref:Basal-body rod modification protein FlgD n=1 Tax=Phytopseudomonas daroniae TaxID=2487519 RepID=A0A4Q9QR38_9GAMM|nr:MULTISPECIES: flagellar hook assembly protein FlgD [Pseudomonas]TBU83387.1 flagellar biosynthesis protein FlgD [Pseudomonas daroniae]TBU85026.1 flagellar biosynthesis protein FlgD [Pseudomonas sp. FRB 228]TBU93681.1 flagellar biosynthesis protein FlgD [Pseudomonas daroniae]